MENECTIGVFVGLCSVDFVGLFYILFGDVS
jgi:hypothetical protein